MLRGGEAARSAPCIVTDPMHIKLRELRSCCGGHIPYNPANNILHELIIYSEYST